jgi:uncharacterized protein
MSLPLDQLLLVGLVLLASSVVQGTVGFAAGLFGIPLLMLVGRLTLVDAVAISLVAATVQNGAGAWQLRREIDFARAWRPMLIRLATMPLGVLTLYYVGRTGEGLAQLVVGGVVLAIVATQCLVRIRPKPALHPAWEWLAFSLAGFLVGLCGIGGPPMVLWVMLHDWPVARAKAFLFYIFTSSMVPQAIILWLLFGTPFLTASLVGLLGLPVVLGGTLLGLKLGERLPDRIMRPVCMAVLAAIGLVAFLTGLLKT